MEPFSSSHAGTTESNNIKQDFCQAPTSCVDSSYWLRLHMLRLQGRPVLSFACNDMTIEVASIAAMILVVGS